MLHAATILYLRPADHGLIAERRTQYSGPYRAMSAYKGDEETGERDWPWIVVGQAGVNCFGRLWPKEYAVALAAEMNK